MLRMCGAHIESTAWIGHGVYIACARGLRLEKNAHVSHGSYLDCMGGITFEESAGCGPRCILITGTHVVENGPARANRHKAIHAPIMVGAGTWIQVGVTVCPGVTIGRSSVILVGAVVTKDVRPDSVYGGAPARRVQELPTGKEHVVAEPAV